VEKAFIPQIRKIDGNLQDWGRFNALLSNEIINYNELQIYVDTLPPFNNFLEKKELPLHLKKREEAPNYVDSYEAGFNPSKTFGGEKSKNIIIGIRQLDSNDKRENPKEYSQGKEYMVGKDDSFKKPNITSMPNIGNPPITYQNTPINLDRLLKQLIDNQQRIDLY
jgi:hypothetical protein